MPISTSVASKSASHDRNEYECIGISDFDPPGSCKRKPDVISSTVNGSARGLGNLRFKAVKMFFGLYVRACTFMDGNIEAYYQELWAASHSDFLASLRAPCVPDNLVVRVTLGAGRRKH